MHRRAELEGNLRRKPNPKGAQAGARKRNEESDEAIVAGKRGNARGCEGPLHKEKTMTTYNTKGTCSRAINYEEVTALLKGIHIHCRNDTSCPDQLACALEAEHA